MFRREPDPFTPEVPEGHFPCQCAEPTRTRHAGVIYCPHTRSHVAIACDHCLGCKRCREDTGQ